MRRYRADSAGLMQRLHREYGDVTRFRVGPYVMHQVTDPALIKDVLHDNIGTYRRGRVFHGFELFFGIGTMTTDGEQWRTLRTAGQPFYRTGFLNESVPVIAGTVTELLTRWDGLAARGEPVDIVPEMMRLAMGVVSRVLYGHDLTHRADELIPAGRFALSAIFPGSPELILPGWVPGPHRRRLRCAQAAFDNAMDEVITAHEHGRTPPDRMAGTLHAVTDPETGRSFNRQQVLDELKTHFIAGNETTGCGLAWTLYEIARHPDVHSRLCAELDDVLCGRTPAMADLAKLPYLRQVVNESLRLHPPVPMTPREPVHDIELGGYRIPAGSTIFMSQHTVHHDPAHWPDPDVFDPGRFDPDRPGPGRYTYFPFSGGPRRCIGAPLAEIEIQIAVAMITQRYRLSPLPHHPVETDSMISLRPRHGVVMAVEAR
ncbi:cytochrome P450 [Kibdelosporangium banguiense]|uniref:Cytochrome P450 n=1 Tax=Kibdelosporangium banguiense TaxID=1365924 RepID=A0ABS4TU42_9PSEU|nr:cytochrome P450 [Kibdelosporangium banguiense]MBP2327915.1 cytochrome P450 [Kibdelosporangium banguiense]